MKSENLKKIGMNILKVKFNRQIIGEILIGAFVGYLIGLVISYINIFGSSQNAPQICAMASGGFSIMRIYNRQNTKVKN
jgi:NhaP-type Na+/H+ or K+/H+ antiporter